MRLTLDQIRRQAQASADREGVAMAILNLNAVGSGLYVVRHFAPDMEGDRSFVERLDPAKTPGQLAYQADCEVRPLYHDGTARRTWAELDSVARQSWERPAKVEG